MKREAFLFTIIILFTSLIILIPQLILAAVVLDQRSNNNLNAYRLNCNDNVTWQQEVTVGKTGQLVNVAFYVCQKGSAKFFINMGDAWQNDYHDYEITVLADFEEDWGVLDLSSSAINFRKGQKFVIGLTGTNQELWIGDSYNYKGGELWVNGSQYSFEGDYNHDIAFKTYINEGVFKWNHEFVRSGSEGWYEVNGVRVSQQVTDGTGEGIDNFQIYGYIAAWYYRDRYGWNSAYYYVDLLEYDNYQDRKQITQDVGYKLSSGIEDFQIKDYRAIWSYRDNDGYDSAYYYIDCSKGENVYDRKQITPKFGYWAAYKSIEDFQVRGDRAFYYLDKGDEESDNAYYYIDLSEEETAYDRKRITQSGAISNFRVNGDRVSWTWKGDDYYRDLPSGAITKNKSSSGGDSGYYGGFYGIYGGLYGGFYGGYSGLYGASYNEFYGGYKGIYGGYSGLYGGLYGGYGGLYGGLYGGYRGLYGGFYGGYSRLYSGLYGGYNGAYNKREAYLWD